jgi:hypothetical protein
MMNVIIKKYPYSMKRQKIERGSAEFVIVSAPKNIGAIKLCNKTPINKVFVTRELIL